MDTQDNKEPKSRFEYVERFIKILQGAAIIAGICVSYFTYVQQKKEDNRIEEERNHQTAKEYKKAFYEKQLQYYAEATEAAATLVTEDIGTPDYIKARKDFLRLFWGKLCIVEDKDVEASMITFRDVLNEYEASPTAATLRQMEQASIKLGHNARRYTLEHWFDATEIKRFN